MDYEDRLDRADRLASNPFIGLLVDGIAKIETSVGNFLHDNKNSKHLGSYSGPARSQSGSSPRAVADAITDYLYSSPRPGQTLVSYGQRIIVESSDDIVDDGHSSPLVVSYNGKYYSIDINVTATEVELVDA